MLQWGHQLILVNDSIIFPSDSSWNQSAETSDIIVNTVINSVKQSTLKMKLFVATVILWV